MCVCAQVVEALSLKYWSNVWILYSFFDESYADPKVHTRTRAHALTHSQVLVTSECAATHLCIHACTRATLNTVHGLAPLSPHCFPRTPPVRARTQSYGFWIDSGNGFSTLIPGILFVVGACARACKRGRRVGEGKE